jgi:hypothetical protein
VRWNRRTDHNQKLIVEALRKAGCSVLCLNGTIDLLVGKDGRTFLIEVKNKSGRNRLQESQKKLIEEWNGTEIHIVRTVEEALRVIDGKSRKTST